MQAHKQPILFNSDRVLIGDTVKELSGQIANIASRRVSPLINNSIRPEVHADAIKAADELMGLAKALKAELRRKG